jgi:type IV secretion system protein VirD4
LNQIDKAYGANHAILDNCHVRIAFATNDERTARRISDALGMATELRAQRNYAGHRLAPWLGHLMVSRQESARPLLTPGEVMQLPPNEAVVMVSGQPPLRATKLRYYEDRNFTLRLRPPPLLGANSYADRPPAKADPWQTTARIAAATAQPPADTGPAHLESDEGGLARRPALLLDELDAERAATRNDIALLDDGDDFDGASARGPGRRLDPRLHRAARLAALDPDDGIPL